MKTLALIAAIIVLSFTFLTIYFGLKNDGIVWAITLPLLTISVQLLLFAHKRRDKEEATPILEKNEIRKLTK